MAVSFSCGYLPEWASLPLPVVYLILDKLLEPTDHARFAVVCKEWRSLAKDYNHATQRWRKLQIPMLLIPSECQGKTSLTNPKLLYSICEGKICNNIQLQVHYRNRCVGSSHGWLATADRTGQGLTIALQNPFRKAEPIRLPPLKVEIEKPHKGYHDFYIQKVILTADPLVNPDSYVVVALYDLYNYKFAFIRGGQKKWAYIKDDDELYTDVVFYKSQIYAAKMYGGIVALDVSSSFSPSRPPKAKHLEAQDAVSFGNLKSYLVESTKGDLLQIKRLYTDTRCGKSLRKVQTMGFKVYKLVFSDEDGSTVQNVEVKSIGDEALFVGDNHSVSVLASNFPGCHPNSIYYMDDWITAGLSELPDGPWDDMGIFNLEDQTITQHYSLNPNWQCYIPPAIWLVPQFNGLC